MESAQAEPMELDDDVDEIAQEPHEVRNVWKRAHLIWLLFC